LTGNPYISLRKKVQTVPVWAPRQTEFVHAQKEGKFMSELTDSRYLHVSVHTQRYRNAPALP
jgi:hypothetical protein